LTEISCRIAGVVGDTLVRQVPHSFDATPLGRLSPKDLHMRLRDAGDIRWRIFLGAAGSVDWQPEGVAPPALESGQD
jgi:hypothetical protein